MFAKVRPDTYNEWLRRVRSGRCDFGLSNVRLCRLWSGFRLWVGPDTHALEMAIPTSVYVSMVNLWKLPVWQSPQDNINFFLGPARHIMDFARNACTGEGGGALQLETPVPHMCRKAANLG